MNTQHFYTSLKVAALVTAFACSPNLRATTIPPATTPGDPTMTQGGFATVAFRDSAEANMLRNAYQILATGDHDYKGHRVRAMHAVERAGKLLGIDLAGDLKDRQPQPLSDDKLREAQGLIAQVLGAAEVKNQKRITKHLNVAVNEINTALTVR
jgi:hypothetical protein